MGRPSVGDSRCDPPLPLRQPPAAGVSHPDVRSCGIMTDIFVSYAQEDFARVNPLVQELERQNWSVFWDRDIPIGQDWRSYIGRNLDEARCIIAIWSQHSVASEWVAEESNEGLRRRILIPVLIDSVKPPAGFRSKNAAKLIEWQPGHPSPELDRLIQAVRAVLDRASTSELDPEPKPKLKPETPPPPSPPIPRKRLAPIIFGVFLVLGVTLALSNWLSTPCTSGKFPAESVSPEQQAEIEAYKNLWHAKAQWTAEENATPTFVSINDAECFRKVLGGSKWDGKNVWKHVQFEANGQRATYVKDDQISGFIHLRVWNRGSTPSFVMGEWLEDGRIGRLKLQLSDDDAKITEVRWDSLSDRDKEDLNRVD
jgi:hypothetical protein